MPVATTQYDVTEKRKQDYMELVKRLTQYPTGGSTKHRDTNIKLFNAIGKGWIPRVIPARHEDLDEWVEEYKDEDQRDRGPHSSYFYTCFLGEAPKLITMTEEQMRHRLQEVADREMPRGLAQDGSRGQWMTSKQNTKKAIEWFLGDWNGNQGR